MKGEDSVAQLVEQYTFNVWALGSSPSGITKPQRKLGFFYAENASQACLNERMRHKNQTQPKVALKGFALAQCERDGGGVKRSRQSQAY